MNLKQTIRKILKEELLKELGDSTTNTYECYVNYEDEKEGSYGFESDKYEYEIEIRKPLLYHDFSREIYSKGMQDIVKVLKENNLNEKEIRNLSVVAFDIIDDEGYTSNYKEITNDNFFKVMSTIYKTIMRYKKKYKTKAIYVDPSDDRRKNVYFRFFKNYDIVDKVFLVSDGVLVITK